MKISIDMYDLHWISKHPWIKFYYVFIYLYDREVCFKKNINVFLESEKKKILVKLLYSKCIYLKFTTSSQRNWEHLEEKLTAIKLYWKII